MKILFDQNTPRPLARFLVKHEVFTAADQGWERLKNGDLLNAAEAGGFGAMVTADKNLAYQQNLSGRRLALVILPFGRWPKVTPFADEIVEVVDKAEPGSFYEIQRFPPGIPLPSGRGILRQFGSAQLQDDELAIEPIEVAPHPVHKVPTCFFKMVHAGSGAELGRINLRAGSGPHIELYAGHIGYAVEAAHRGHRYASRALRLLMPLAGQFEINPLWITCDPENVPSRRTCELAGGKLVEVVDVPATCIIYQSGHPKKCRYRFTTRSELARS